MREIPFYMLISMGQIIGFSYIHKFGHNPDIDTAGGFETIWSGGGKYSGHDSVAAEIVEVFSRSRDDNFHGGDGARTIKLLGLDENYNPIVETVVLNGTIPRYTENRYIRLDRMIIQTAGDSGANIGNITARQKESRANVFAVIPAGYNQTMQAAYTIPAGFKGFLVLWFAGFSGEPNVSCRARILARPFGQVFQVKEELPMQGGGNSSFHRTYNTPRGPYEEKTDIKIEAAADANNVFFGAGFDLLLVDYKIL